MTSYEINYAGKPTIAVSDNMINADQVAYGLLNIKGFKCDQITTEKRERYTMVEGWNYETSQYELVMIWPTES